MIIQQPHPTWYMDMRSTSHLTNDPSKISQLFGLCSLNYTLVKNGSYLPIIGHDPSIASHLNNPAPQRTYLISVTSSEPHFVYVNYFMVTLFLCL